MKRRDLLLRMAIVAVPLVATMAAFSTGRMALAMIGTVVSALVFHRAFMRGY